VESVVDEGLEPNMPLIHAFMKFPSASAALNVLASEKYKMEAIPLRQTGSSLVPVLERTAYRLMYVAKLRGRLCAVHMTVGCLYGQLSYSSLATW
jgi:hypothetical protein